MRFRPAGIGRIDFDKSQVEAAVFLADVRKVLRIARIPALSRGALVDDIVYTIALTAIQAVQMAE